MRNLVARPVEEFSTLMQVNGALGPFMAKLDSMPLAGKHHSVIKLHVANLNISTTLTCSACKAKSTMQVEDVEDGSTILM
jgi:hypothetical protein